jgi:DNA-binding winged helix-turn-helix (wHTH) protein/tetratricopeptide (TPR) repeat protein
MQEAPRAHAFGPFRLDTAACRLLRDDSPVDLSPRLYDLLRLLVSRPGELIPKEELLEALWPGVFVTENSLTRAISDLRLVLGDDAAAPRFVQTVARRGYRFVAPVEMDRQPAHEPGSDASGDPLAAYRAWAEGRLRLESLSRDALPGAIASIERARSLAPRDPLVHVALANAYLLGFEATRASHEPDRAKLERAVAEAREGCALAPTLGEAWATLGFVLVSAAEPGEARAAARRAVDLEPGDWRHQFRLAHATWGEERLRAVDRALALFPGFPFAYFLAAMVHIARGALDVAEATLVRGTEAQDAQAGRPATFPASGLHWLRGLVRSARGDARGAVEEFDRELTFESSRSIYAAEFAANACVGRGAALLDSGEPAGAAEAFRAALDRLPGHARAYLGLALALEQLGRANEAREERASLDESLAALAREHRPAEAAIVSAAAMTADGHTAEGMAALERFVVSAPPGFAGWTIPVEPWFRGLARTPGFTRVLRALAERAS